MKFRRFLFAFLISLAAFQFCFSQEKPGAVLITEFGDANCETLLAQMDYFITDLNNDPNSQGYAIIYGKKNYLREGLTYELWINGAIKFSRFDDSRITKIRGEEAESLRIQFWKVPAGAEKPEFKEAKWNFAFPESTKPFIFYDYYWDQICSHVSFEKVFAEFLAANQDAHGHIVIYQKSAKSFLKTKKEIINLLADTHKNQLKFFFVKRIDSNVEFWLVPKMKRK